MVAFVGAECWTMTLMTMAFRNKDQRNAKYDTKYMVWQAQCDRAVFAYELPQVLVWGSGCDYHDASQYTQGIR